MGFTKMSQTQKNLEINGRKITLIGTAHVSKESIDEVENTIKELKPDCVAIELDEKRAEAIQNPDKYSKLDIVKVIKKNEGFLMMANLILSSYQRRMGLNSGVKPGDEMLAALKIATQLNIPCSMVDRPIQITLKRAWAKNSLWGKCKLLSSLLASAFSKEEVSSEEIENLKKSNEMDSMMNELSDYLPIIKEVLIDERDKYLAQKIWNSNGNSIVAVLGAGHLPGVTQHLEKLSNNEQNIDLEEISKVPPKSFISKLIGWIIPVLIVGLIVAGFIYGGKKAGTSMLSSWFLWNGGLSALFSLIVAANPLTIIVSFLAAPFTSLCPFVGVGFVSGLLQAIICKPKVCDLESLQDDVTSIKGFYKNRILKTLLVLIFSSLGSSIGTFVAGADIVKTLVQI